MQKNAWMSFDLYYSRFYNIFVSIVSRELTSQGIESKALLLLDKCPAPKNLLVQMEVRKETASETYYRRRLWG